MEILTILVVLFILSRVARGSVVFVKPGETRVVEKLGKVDRILKPGLHILLPLIERAVASGSSAEQELEWSGSEATTRDGFPVGVHGSAAYRVTDPAKAKKQGADLEAALSKVLDSRWRKALGQVDVRQVYAKREEMAREIESALSAAAHHFGAELLRFAIDRLEPPTRDLGSASDAAPSRSPQLPPSLTAIDVKGESVRLAGDHEVDVAGIRAETGGGERLSLAVHVRFTYRASVRTAEAAVETLEDLRRIVRETVIEEVGAMEALPGGGDMQRLGDLVLRALRSEARDAGAAVDRLNIARLEGRG